MILKYIDEEKRYHKHQQNLPYPAVVGLVSRTVFGVGPNEVAYKGKGEKSCENPMAGSDVVHAFCCFMAVKLALNLAGGYVKSQVFCKMLWTKYFAIIKKRALKHLR
jgi:hypothetical protein